MGVSSACRRHPQRPPPPHPGLPSLHLKSHSWIQNLALRPFTHSRPQGTDALMWWLYRLIFQDQTLKSWGILKNINFSFKFLYKAFLKYSVIIYSHWKFSFSLSQICSWRGGLYSMFTLKPVSSKWTNWKRSIDMKFYEFREMTAEALPYPRHVGNPSFLN